MQSLTRRTLLTAAPLLVLGCSKPVPLYASPTQLGGGVMVDVYRAYVDDDRIFVKSQVTNTSDVPIRISRDGWSLELPGGEVLPRSVGITTRHNTYTIAPGAGRDVFVDFRKEGVDLTTIGGATLIVAGVGLGDDPQPREVGPVKLSTTVQPKGTPLPPPSATAEPEAGEPVLQ